MKTAQRGIPVFAALLLIITLIGFACHGQSDSSLQLVAPGDVPPDGTFYLLSGYLATGGSIPAPFPFNPATNGLVYSLDGSSYLVDDSTNDQEALDALALLLQPQDSSSANLLGGMTAMDSADPQSR